MSIQLVKRSKFWSAETSIFTRLATIVQMAYVVASVVPIAVIFIEFEFINWWLVGVLILVISSVVLSFSGRKNLGFVLAILAIVVHLFSSAVNGTWTIFTVEWEIVFSGGLLFPSYSFVASLLFLPLATVLLIIGRPEWKKIGKS
jgi:hypothetical protein